MARICWHRDKVSYLVLVLTCWCTVSRTACELCLPSRSTEYAVIYRDRVHRASHQEIWSNHRSWPRGLIGWCGPCPRSHAGMRRGRGLNTRILEALRRGGGPRPLSTFLPTLMHWHVVLLIGRGFDPATRSPNQASPENSTLEIVTSNSPSRGLGILGHLSSFTDDIYWRLHCGIKQIPTTRTFGNQPASAERAEPFVHGRLKYDITL